MGLINNKPKIDVESFYKAYYDNQMFHSVINGLDISQKILDIAFQMLTDSIPSFSKVDRVLFDSEMTAMHLELFALAFFQRFNNFDKALQQGIFTLYYLRDKGRIDLWETMSAYTKAVAQTATMNDDGQLMTGKTAIGRMTITRVNTLRAELFSKYYKIHVKDPKNPTADERGIADCIALVCNHIEADILRNKNIGNRRIATLFLYRLGAEDIFGENWSPSEDFLLRIAVQPYSMYDFATQSLKNADFRFSK